MTALPSTMDSSLCAHDAADRRHVTREQGLRIAVVANTAWNLFNFRLNLMRELQADGHAVIAVAQPDKYVQALQSAGFAFEH